MKIEKIIGEELFKSVDQMRESSETYEELIFLREDISVWNKSLTEKLGPPLIPNGKTVAELSENMKMKKDAALKIANSFGGINKGQTLYHGIFDSISILVMLWPWQDNMHVTLKKIIP